ncbi:MAG: hypothetical protein HOP29_20085, partial [Phycisphaerales bacterium]|nr:hypothetical protein [Phycisphaerales bacterium]
MIANAEFDTGTTADEFDDDGRAGASERVRSAMGGNGTDRAGAHVERVKDRNGPDGVAVVDHGAAGGVADVADPDASVYTDAGMGAEDRLVVALAGGATVVEAARGAG